MRKGQFMIITAIIVSLIIISLSASLTELKGQKYQNSKQGYIIEVVEKEAKNIDKSDKKEVENFKKMLRLLNGYRTSVTVWKRSGKPDCFNVTLLDSNSRIEMKCVG